MELYISSNAPAPPLINRSAPSDPRFRHPAVPVVANQERVQGDAHRRESGGEGKDKDKDSDIHISNNHSEMREHIFCQDRGRLSF